MLHRQGRSVVLGLLSLALFTTTVTADARRLGSEQAVSVSQVRQRNPVVGLREDGGGWVVWENVSQGLVARRIARNGVPTGGEILLVANQNLPTIPGKGNVRWNKEAAVASLADGGFLLAWSVERIFLTVEIFYERRDVIDRFVYSQRFDANGQPVGRALRVDPTTAFKQGAPRVVVGATWAAVVWQQALASDDSVDKGELRGRFFALATGRGGESFQIAGAPSTYASLSADRADNLWVAWQSLDSSGDGVFARIVRPSGRPLGDAVRVNDTVVGCQRRPALVAREGGGYWLFFHGPTSGDESRIFARRLSPSGIPTGAESTVSPGSHEDEVYPAAASLGGGRYLVMWMSWWRNFPQGFFARELREDGGTLESVGEETALNEFRAYTQFRTALGVASGRVIGAWESLAPRQRQAGISIQAFSAGD